MESGEGTDLGSIDEGKEDANRPGEETKEGRRAFFLGRLKEGPLQGERKGKRRDR